MDTLSVFLVDLEQRWNWNGVPYPNDQHTVAIVMKHLGIHIPHHECWTQVGLLIILEALVKRALAEEQP